MTTITYTLTDGTTSVTLGGSIMSWTTTERTTGDEYRFTDSMRIKVTGATISAARTTEQSMNLLLKNAERWDRNRIGSRIYINYDPGGTGTTWRALVYSGTVELDANMSFKTWDQKYLFFSVNIVRDAWEGPEAELSLANGSGSGTGGRSISNNDYSTADNWVTITGSAVAGDLPAQCRVELYHSYATNPFQKYIWIFHKTDGLTNFTHVWEGEDGGGGSTTGDAAASGSNKQTLSWSGATLTKLWDETLTANFVNSVAHGKLNVLLRIDSTAYTDLYMQFMLRNSTGSTLVKASPLVPVPASQTMVSLGYMRLPPSDTGGTNSTYLFELWAQRLSGGSPSIELDYVQFSPIAPYNSWRKFTAIDGGLKYQETLIDDGIDGRTYRLVSSTRIPDFVSEGGPIMLQPGQDQKLIVSAMETGGAYYKAQTFTVRVYYRPRYRVI